MLNRVIRPQASPALPGVIGSSWGPSPTSKRTLWPSASGMTRMSENRIAASRSNRRSGCRVTSGSQLGRVAEVEKRAGPGAHLPIFRQIATGLPHDPERWPCLALAADRRQQWLCHRLHSRDHREEIDSFIIIIMAVFCTNSCRRSESEAQKRRARRVASASWGRWVWRAENRPGLGGVNGSLTNLPGHRRLGTSWGHPWRCGIALSPIHVLSFHSPYRVAGWGRQSGSGLASR